MQREIFDIRDTLGTLGSLGLNIKGGVNNSAGEEKMLKRNKYNIFLTRSPKSCAWLCLSHNDAPTVKTLQRMTGGRTGGQLNS